jgi:hypothetical protein
MATKQQCFASTTPIHFPKEILYSLKVKNKKSQHSNNRLRGFTEPKYSFDLSYFHPLSRSKFPQLQKCETRSVISEFQKSEEILCEEIVVYANLQPWLEKCEFCEEVTCIFSFSDAAKQGRIVSAPHALLRCVSILPKRSRTIFKIQKAHLLSFVEISIIAIFQ